MIKHLQIKNFKSIKELEFDCARVNVFIGGPNTGKSNILESVGILSFGYTDDIKDFVRFEKSSNLFHNNKINKAVKITLTIGRELINISPFAHDIDGDVTHEIEIIYLKDSNLISIKSKGEGNVILPEFELIYDAFSERFLGSGGPITTTMIKFYPVRFFRLNNLKYEKPDEIYILKPPDGRNLMNVIKTNGEILNNTLDLLKPYGFKEIKFSLEGKISFNRRINDTFDEIPFELLSDTLIKMIMLNAAIKTSSKHILLFEEPETHVFPFYNEQLALMIADNSNQFFIATHNPYFLNMLINKTPAEQLHVFKVTYKDYQTHAKLISKNTLQKFVINDNDILLNIDRLDETI